MILDHRLQGPFWLWAHSMTNGVSKKWRLSLVAPIARQRSLGWLSNTSQTKTLLFWIYIYIYGNQHETKQYNTQKHVRYQWMIASFNYNFTQLVNARVTHLAWRELWYKDIICTYISGTTRWSRGDKSQNFVLKNDWFRSLPDVTGGTEVVGYVGGQYENGHRGMLGHIVS